MHEELFTIPITEPVTYFTVLLLFILAVPLLAEKLKIPGIVGLIITGIIVGPHGLNLVDRGARIILLATIGLLYLMFIAGLEIDMVMFKKYRRRSILLGFLSFAIPQAAGTLVSLYIGYSLMPSLLIGAILASHTLLAYPIISKLGLGKTISVTTAVGGTILTDLLALLVLAIITGATKGNIDVWFWVKFFLLLIIYTISVFTVLPAIGRLFFRHIGINRESEFMFVFTSLFFVSFMAKVIDMEAIIGAFLAGLTLNKLIPENSPLMNRIQFIGNTIFVPFFLIATGMLVDLNIIFKSKEVWITAGALTFTVIAGKYLAGWLTGKLYHYSSDEIMIIFSLSVPHAAATLAVTLTGLKLGLLDESTVNAVIIMILITCTLGPFIAQKYGRKVGLTNLEDKVDPVEKPERILVTLNAPEKIETVMEFAMLLRNSSLNETLFPLVVINKSTSNLDNYVASAEKQLHIAEKHAAGADVKVSTLTRVGLNIPSAMKRAVIETRASILILDWDGEVSFEERVFGRVIDQIITEIKIMTFIICFPKPANIVKRMIFLLPSHARKHSGFKLVTYHVKKLAHRLNAPVTVYMIGDENEKNKTSAVIEQVKPDMEHKVKSFNGWSDLQETFFNEVRGNDLVVLLSERQDSLSWEPEMKDFPRDITRTRTFNSIVIYHPEFLTVPEIVYD